MRCAGGVTAALASMASVVAVVASAVACGGTHPVAVQAPFTSVNGTTGSADTTEATAAAISADPRVGAVFLGDQTLHVCSGSVLATVSGDLILTAAHCLADGVDAYFAPGFSEDTGPADFRRVDAVFLDPRWLESQDPLADFAIARVSRDGPQTVQERAGGGFALGVAPPVGAEITVHGYLFGWGADQLGCRARADVHGAFPKLPCEGLGDGTSGAPWISGATVTGIVGGLDGGGCDEHVSYSPPFGAATAALLARAEAGGAGDAAPTALDDGC